MFKKLHRGFTLIELLVVIAIIGILASIIIVNLSTSRAKGRDAVRKSDLHQIKNALEIYASDSNNLYPCVTIACDDSESVTSNTGPNGTWSDPEAAILLYDSLTGNGQLDTTPALSVLPVDPRNDDNYYYRYTATGCSEETAGCTEYVLTAILEAPGDSGFACWQDSISTVGPVACIPG